MSQYDILDKVILDSIKNGRFRWISYQVKEIRHELYSISRNTDRDARKILDGRLTALKAKGKIEYVRGANYGWQLKQKVGI